MKPGVFTLPESRKTTQANESYLNIFQVALCHYAKGSNARLIGIFVLVASLAAVLTFAHVFFIGQKHDSLLLRYLLPLLMLLAGGIFIYLACSAKDGFAGIAHAVLAIILLIAALVSFLVKLLLLLLYEVNPDFRQSDLAVSKRSSSGMITRYVKIIASFISKPCC